MKNIGVFVDLSNLYYSIESTYGPKSRINFEAYMDYIKDLGSITQAHAYGAQINNQAQAFIRHIESAGFTTHYKKPRTYKSGDGIIRKADWDVGITLDIIKAAEHCSMIVLGSADSDFVPLVEHLQADGKSVLVLACSISHELKHITNCVEIPPSFLKGSVPIC